MGWCQALVLCASLAWMGVAESAKEPPPGRITLNFVNADIGSVIKAMGEMTGRTFVVDPRVKGTINVTSPRPVARSVAYDILLAALRMQGYAAVQSDGVVRIVPEADAKFYATPSAAKMRPGKVGGEMVTRVFALHHESATQLVAALRPLVGANSTINADAGTNTLLVTDYVDNLGRLERVIENLDVPSADEPVLIPLKYASAPEIAGLVTRVFTPAQATPGGGVFDLLQVGVDDRSNTLIVRGRDRSLVGKVQNLAASLDVPTPVAGNVHVLYLKNAAASDVAKTLRNILSGDTAAAPTQAGQPGKPAAEGGPGMVQADAASNTLIITAPEAVFTNLKAVVEKLDVRRAQVLVEALIAEISADKAAEFGIQWLYLNRLNSANLSAIGAFGNSSTTSNIAAVAANPIGVAQGLTLGLVHGTINVPGIGEITNLNLLARALKTTTNANILSTPTLLTLDNEEAKMSVGSNVAFATGSFTTPNTVASGNGVVSPFTTFQRQDVGLLLKVRPQISQGGTVRLQISQEVSKLRPAADPTLAQTDKRAIDSTVLVDSGQIVVLGGLIDDQVQDTEDRVPLLGDIPGLGHFFRYTTRQHTKTNLMVFLRPIIVRDAATAAAVTNPRYEYILGLEKASAPPHHVVLPDESSPTLNDSTRPGNVKGPEDKTHATP